MMKVQFSQLIRMLSEIYGKQNEWHSYIIQLFLKVTNESLLKTLNKGLTLCFHFMFLSCSYLHIIMIFLQLYIIGKGTILTKRR